MRVVHRGKDKNLISVGPSKAFDRQTIQAGFDLVASRGDAAEDNPYVISVAPGLYDEQVTVDEDSGSYVSLEGESRSASILGYSGSDGGSLILSGSAPGTPVEHFRCYNMRILRQADVLEEAIQLGGEYPGGNALETDSLFDDILFENCVLEGGGEVVNISGNASTSTLASPYVMFRNNRFNTHECAIEANGNLRLVTQGNYTLCDVDHAFDLMPTAGGAKSRCFLKYSHRDAVRSDAYISSSHDTFNGQNVYTTSGLKLAQRIGGYLFAALFGSGVGMPIFQCVSPTIRIAQRSGTSHANAKLAGFVINNEDVVWGTEDFMVVGGSVAFDSQVASGMPSDWHGAAYFSGAGTPSEIHLAGIGLKSNNRGGGTQPTTHACTADGSNQTIRAAIYSGIRTVNALNSATITVHRVNGIVPALP